MSFCYKRQCCALYTINAQLTATATEIFKTTRFVTCDLQKKPAAYANHVLIGNNSDISISIRRTQGFDILMLMLMSQPSSLTH